MISKTVYQPRYANSWALVIGINDYQIASPLGYARQDAEAFAEALARGCSWSFAGRLPDCNLGSYIDSS